MTTSESVLPEEVNNSNNDTKIAPDLSSDTKEVTAIPVRTDDDDYDDKKKLPPAAPENVPPQEVNKANNDSNLAPDVSGDKEDAIKPVPTDDEKKPSPSASESISPQELNNANNEDSTRAPDVSGDKDDTTKPVPTDDEKKPSLSASESIPPQELNNANKNDSTIAPDVSGGKDDTATKPVPTADQKKPLAAAESVPPQEVIQTNKDTAIAPDSSSNKEVAAKPVRTDDQKKPPPSKERKSGRGLSELSKQLRVLQAKNQSQSVEIDRLERQLRILADLQGISVADLRRALQEACEAEAFGELQHRVASLRAQLEAASLAKQHSAAAENAAASAHKIANLELRIGELEEIEEKQRAEIQNLYSQLMEQKANVTRLEALCEHQRSENERLKEQQTKADPQENSPQSELLRSQQAALEAKARDAEVEVQILKERLALSEQQREAAEEQSRLRHAQYKARFLVQDEKIQDLEQQLSSLYTAFEMLREERTQEEAKRVALQSNLHAADEQVARDLDSSSRSITSPLSSHVIPESPSVQKAATITDAYVVSPPEGEPILSGFLLVRSNKFLKKWKQRDAFLFSTLADHTLNIIGEQVGSLKLQFGVSTVEPFHKHDYAFVIRVNPNIPNAAVVHAAAQNEQEYHQWMAALTAATTGEEYAPTQFGDTLNVMSMPPTDFDDEESYREHTVL